MDAVTSHPGGGASEYSDQSECISSQPTTGRPRLLQCAGQHATPETQSQVDVQRNTSHCHVIANVAPGTDSLSAAPPPPPPCTNKKRLSSSESHTLIEEVAGDDCCVHCLLACLFCELRAMCWAAERCVTRGGPVSSCCGLVDTCCSCCCRCCCRDEACEAPLDCGILEECCSSTDCLEICLECCAICFPS
ncbi:myoD family inhibitor isoform X1 [Phyllopteryx taeniolatus]|uniref:myoD family inhibitor isoform X1 n=1 Tax=Phyllopteryx taeniolatus TaxID=161469 RepID=UPI002AD4BCA3|nr:myoD family inhibitor isoform X1 [Phyllopteryx taeniolatus]